MTQEYNQQDQISYELALKLRDLEEYQKLSKERLLLLGQNLLEMQEKNSEDINEIKKNLQILKDDVKRMKSTVEILSEEVSKSARKEELAILARQYKMFQPLEFARIKDVEKIIDKKMHTHHKKNSESNSESKEINELTEAKKDFWSGKL